MERIRINGGVAAGLSHWNGGNGEEVAGTGRTDIRITLGGDSAGSAAPDPAPSVGAFVLADTRGGGITPGLRLAYGTPALNAAVIAAFSASRERTEPLFGVEIVPYSLKPGKSFVTGPVFMLLSGTDGDPTSFHALWRAEF